MADGVDKTGAPIAPLIDSRRAPAGVPSGFVLDQLSGTIRHFCEKYYEQQVGRVRHPVPIIDFVFDGSLADVSPHWAFDEKYYLRWHPHVRSVKEAGNLITALQHYLQFTDPWSHRPHPLIDSDLIAESYPEARSYRDPIDFIAQTHRYRPVSTSSLFDHDWYEFAIRREGLSIGMHRPFESLIEHFFRSGIGAGLSPIPDFDTDYYLNENPEVREAQSEGKGKSAFEHFLHEGIRQHKNPNRYFDSRYYLDSNPDVKAEIARHRLLGPFEHFMRFGIARGYRASPPSIQVEVDADIGKMLYERRCRSSAEKLLKSGSQLANADRPTVSVIVPVFNQFPMTARLLACLQAAQADTSTPAFETIVVDNGSSDETTELCRLCPGVAVLRVDEPLGYTRACNLGAVAARGEFILFCNNDIEFEPGAIAALLDGFDEGVAVTGGKILQMNERIQEAGSFVWRDGSGHGYGRNDQPWMDLYSVRRPVDYVSGCWLMVRATVFTELDGFDEAFAPGYFEETDLCVRAWQAGYRVMYIPESEIRHFEYASYSRGRPASVSRHIMHQKREIFRNKNREWLQAHRKPHGAGVTASAWSWDTDHKHFALIDDLLPEPVFGSGFGRMRTIIDALREREVLCHLHVAREERGYSAYDVGLGGVPVRITRHMPAIILDHLRGIGERLDVLWVSRTHNGEILNGFGDELRTICPNAKIVLDTEAIVTSRDRLRLGTAKSDELDEWYAKAIEKELAFTRFCDEVVVVNEFDRAIIRQFGGRDATVLGHYFDDRAAGPDHAARRDLLFFGSMHTPDCPNLDSVRWFATEVLPLVRRQIPDIGMSCYGYLSPRVRDSGAMEIENVRHLGVAPDLKAICDEARLFVAPTRFAGGIAHKVEHALSLGLPVVTTDLIANQLVYGTLDKAHSPVASAPRGASQAFADQIVRLYNDSTAWRDQKNLGDAYVRTVLSRDRFVERLMSICFGSTASAEIQPGAAG